VEDARCVQLKSRWYNLFPAAIATTSGSRTNIVPSGQRYLPSKVEADLGYA
jgi:hypothetical protein